MKQYVQLFLADYTTFPSWVLANFKQCHIKSCMTYSQTSYNISYLHFGSCSPSSQHQLVFVYYLNVCLFQNAFVFLLFSLLTHFYLIIASIEFSFLSCLNALFLAFTTALQSSFHQVTFLIRISPVVLGIISSAD